MRRNYRKPTPNKVVHEIIRNGNTIICSTCGKLSQTIRAEIDGKPMKEYCPTEYREIISGERLAPAKKKYGKAVPKTVMVDGVKRSHQSGGEADRHVILSLRQKAGEIENLQSQVMFRLDVNGVHICKYYADFSYNLVGYPDDLIVEDFKGRSDDHAYRIYLMKVRLMKACHGIDVVTVWQNEKRSRQVKR